jgi:hypothetical protein
MHTRKHKKGYQRLLFQWDIAKNVEYASDSSATGHVDRNNGITREGKHLWKWNLKVSGIALMHIRKHKNGSRRLIFHWDIAKNVVNARDRSATGHIDWNNGTTREGKHLWTWKMQVSGIALMITRKRKNGCHRLLFHWDNAKKSKMHVVLVVDRNNGTTREGNLGLEEQLSQPLFWLKYMAKWPENTLLWWISFQSRKNDYHSSIRVFDHE